MRYMSHPTHNSPKSCSALRTSSYLPDFNMCWFKTYVCISLSINSKPYSLLFPRFPLILLLSHWLKCVVWFYCYSEISSSESHQTYFLMSSKAKQRVVHLNPHFFSILEKSHYTFNQLITCFLLRQIVAESRGSGMLTGFRGRISCKLR